MKLGFSLARPGQRAAGCTHRHCTPGFAQRYIKAEHRRVVLTLSGNDMAGCVEHDNGQRVHFHFLRLGKGFFNQGIGLLQGDLGHDSSVDGWRPQPGQYCRGGIALATIPNAAAPVSTLRRHAAQPPPLFYNA